MPAKRKRKQFKFWLNVLHPQEKYLADVIQWLTEQGEFVRSIRDGLRLIYDLRFQKDHASLLELFPDIRERLQVQPAPPVSGGGQSELAKEIAAQIVLMNGNTGYLMQSSNLLQPAPPLPNSEATGTIISNLYKPPTGKQLAAPKFALPSFEEDPDDQPTILIKKSTNTDSGANLIAALRSMA